MFSTKGQPRQLSDADVEEILEWAREPRSARQLARRYPVSFSTVHKIIKANGAHYNQPPRLGKPGRPRELTEGQVREILEWVRTHRTVRDVAAHYGVSPSTIYLIVNRGNYYKQPSPELRAKNLDQQRQKLRRLRAQGYV